MAFRFGLQSVLHLRQGLERQQEQHLRAANEKVNHVKIQIVRAEQRLRAFEEVQADELRTGTTAAELMFATQCQAQLHRDIRDLEQRLAAARKACEQQRLLFQRARREREKLDNLRDQQSHAYLRQAARREQRTLDDLFLLRREFLHR